MFQRKQYCCGFDADFSLVNGVDVDCGLSFVCVWCHEFGRDGDAVGDAAFDDGDAFTSIIVGLTAGVFGDVEWFGDVVCGGYSLEFGVIRGILLDVLNQCNKKWQIFKRNLASLIYWIKEKMEKIKNVLDCVDCVRSNCVCTKSYFLFHS